MLGGGSTDYTNIRPAFTGPNPDDHRGQLWYKVFHPKGAETGNTINNDNSNAAFFLNAENYDGRNKLEAAGKISHGISQFIVDYASWVKYAKANPGLDDVKSFNKSKEAHGENASDNLYTNWDLDSLAKKLPLLGDNWTGIEQVSDDGKLTYTDNVDSKYLRNLFLNQDQYGAGIYSTKSPTYIPVADLTDANRYEAFLVGGDQTVTNFFTTTSEGVDSADFGVGEPGKPGVTGPVISRNAKGDLTINGKNAKEQLNSGAGTVCAALKGLETCSLKNGTLAEGELLHEVDSVGAKSIKASGNPEASVAQLNPEVAFGFLKMAGFEAQRRFDSAAGKNLLKVEPVDQWAERVKINTSDFAGYIAYLRLVAAFVDQNPAILNEDHRDGPVALPESGDPFGLSFPLGKQRRETNLDDFRDQISRRNRYIETMVNGLVGMPLKLRLYGGGVRTVPAPSMVDAKVARIPRVSKTLRRIYSYYQTRLRSQNKELSEKTLTKIEAHLASLEREEVKVIKVVKFVESYALLNDAMADFSTRTGITADTLKTMYAKYEKAREAVNRKSNNLVDIIETLVHATKDQEQNVPLR
jgi:hypothetical protein